MAPTIPRPSEVMLRGMAHHYGRRSIAFSMAVAFVASGYWYFFYTVPRAKKYEEFFKNYDPYTRAKEICGTNKGYMISCPQELAKLAEEKGVPIADLK